MTTRAFSYGGQAVFEGVMMRGQHQATVAVRRANGSLAYRHERLSQRRRRLMRVPLLRGMLALWDTLGLGMRAMTFATLVARGEESEPISAGQLRLTLVATLCMIVGIFFVVPLLAGSIIALLLPARIAGAPESLARLLIREASDGLLRLLLFVGYIRMLGRSAQAQRLFGYHGAEHKAVNAYEAQAPLSVDEVRRFTLIHPRCGTSFFLLVIVISIIVFALFGGLPFWARLLSRVALVPFIAALTYEVVKLAAAQYHRRWVRSLLAPTLKLQRLTTREPDDSMIEVAIAALSAVLRADGQATTQPYEQAQGTAPTAA